MQLAVLAAAAFVYVTAEMVPVGALPDIASGLHVSEALVATLLASYAFIAAVTTVPLVRLTAHWPRRRALLLAMVCLTVSQLISALAPNFAVLAGSRVLCAATHGLMWSVIAPIGARLLPATHTGRATAAVYVGTTVALVVGNPLTAAMSELWGWRQAVVAVTLAAAAVTVAARATLPPMAADRGRVATRSRLHRDGRLVTLSALTLIGVTGHFVSYTFIVVLIRDVVGVRGPQLAWLLAGFGIAGLAGMAATARPADRNPRASVAGCLAVLAAVFAGLAALADGRPVGFATVAVGTAAIVAWGAASTALSPMLQAAVMRTAPGDPDGASSVYVTAFQVGIMAGSLAGGLLYEHAGLAVMIASSSALMMVAFGGVLAGRGLFSLRPGNQQEVTSGAAGR